MGALLRRVSQKASFFISRAKPYISHAKSCNENRKTGNANRRLRQKQQKRQLLQPRVLNSSIVHGSSQTSTMSSLTRSTKRVNQTSSLWASCSTSLLSVQRTNAQHKLAGKRALKPCWWFVTRIPMKGLYSNEIFALPTKGILTTTY